MLSCIKCFSAALYLPVILVLVGSGCSKKGQETTAVASPDQPNVLLITLDTTRADRLGCYGWQKARTPVLDKLSKEGTRFEKAYSPLPFTLPAHTSVMTGLYPFYHGVRENTRFRVSPSLATLAESFQESGYQTCGVIGAFVLDKQFGLDQGFDAYLDEMPELNLGGTRNVPELSARHVSDKAIDWIDKSDSSKPWFCWVHYYDPHYPYKPPMSFPYSMSDPYDAEIAYMDMEIGRVLESLPKDRPTIICAAGDHGEGLGDHGELTHGYFVYNPTIEVPLILTVPDGQAGSVIQTPISLVDVMPTLLELAGLDVPGSDEIHGRSLVPLLEGVSGADAEFADRLIYFETYAPTYNFGWAPQFGGIHEEWKYIHSPKAELYNLAANPREEIAQNKVTSESAVASRMESSVRELRDQQLAFPPASGEGGPLDAEAVRKLQSLGYLSGATLSIDEGTDRADLKDKLIDYQKAKTAEGMIRTGQVGQGVKELIRLHKENPESPAFISWLADAMKYRPQDCIDAIPIVLKAAQDEKNPVDVRAEFFAWIGNAEFAKLNNKKAIAMFTEAIALEQENALWRFMLGRHFLFYLKDIPAAITELSAAAELEPDNSAYTLNLGVAHLEAGRFREASDLFAKTLNRISIWDAYQALSPFLGNQETKLIELADSNEAPAKVRAMAMVIRSRFVEGNPSLEASLIEKAFKIDPDAQKDPFGLLEYGSALKRSGQIPEALEQFKKAVHMAPDDFKALREYCLLLAQSGEEENALARMTAFQKKHPDNPVVAACLAELLCIEGKDLDRALKLAKQAAWQDDANARISATLGRIYLARKNPKSAIHALLQASYRAPHVADYQYYLGKAYQLDGQYEKALGAFQKAYSLGRNQNLPWMEEVLRIIETNQKQ